jgi:hypothetical protein
MTAAEVEALEKQTTEILKKRAFPGQMDSGMELRDWFAGMALQGLLAAQPDPEGTPYSEIAYRFADSMLVARESKKK